MASAACSLHFSSICWLDAAAARPSADVEFGAGVDSRLDDTLSPLVPFNWLSKLRFTLVFFGFKYNLSIGLTCFPLLLMKAALDDNESCCCCCLATEAAAAAAAIVAKSTLSLSRVACANAGIAANVAAEWVLFSLPIVLLVV